MKPMPKYRENLPQLKGDLFLTDGGIETTLVFHHGIDLPEFAAFPLMRSEATYHLLAGCMRSYADIAKESGTGVVLETVTWRASREWGEKLGYSLSQIEEANRQAVQMLLAMRPDFEASGNPLVISGCIGPRGDGYVVSNKMSPAEAQEYHSHQIGVFADTEADLVTVMTMNYPEEAIGVASAAKQAGIPCVVSFTLETDGRLPNGQPLGDAILEVDEATDGYPAYFMINCAHPTHFSDVFDSHDEWWGRIKGLRANASQKSHAELEESTSLDEGNPYELGMQYAEFIKKMGSVNVLGGCCGTDPRHVGAIARACAPLYRS